MGMSHGLRGSNPRVSVWSPVSDNTFIEVRKLAADVFETKEDAVTLASTPQTVENWDSIQHLNFVLALENRFGIEFSAEEMESMRSIADAVRIIKSK